MPIFNETIVFDLPLDQSDRYAYRRVVKDHITKSNSGPVCPEEAEVAINFLLANLEDD
jgi:hypothetical protein